MKRLKILPIIPFIAISVLMGYTWYQLVSEGYVITMKHKLGLALFAVNLFIYFVNLRIAIVFTALSLLIAVLNFSSLFADITTTSFFMKVSGRELSTPGIQLNSLLLLLLYAIFHFFFSRDIFLKAREGKVL